MFNAAVGSSSVFKFVVEGPAANLIAAGIAGVGSRVKALGVDVGVELVNPEEAIKSITAVCGFFAAYGFVQKLKGISFAIVVATRSLEATHKLFNDWYSGDVLTRLNEALRDVLATKSRSPVHFVSLKLDCMKITEMSQMECKDKEQRANLHVEDLITKINARFAGETVLDQERALTLVDKHEEESEDFSSDHSEEDSAFDLREKVSLREYFCTSGPASLTEQRHEARELLKSYGSCLKSSKMKEAETLILKITSIIGADRVSTGDELWDFARELRGSEQPLESFAIYVAASSQYRKETKAGDALDRMKLCVGGMLDASWTIVQSDAEMKRVVTGHVIPQVRRIMDAMEEVTSVNDEIKCKEVVWVIRQIGACERDIKDREGAVKTYEEGLKRFKDVFQKDAMKSMIYGDMLKNLGDLHKKLHRLEEWLSCHQQAMQVFQSAIAADNDPATKGWRWTQRWVQKLESGLFMWLK